MLYRYVEKAIKKPFHLIGLDLVWRNQKEQAEDQESELPPLLEDPLEALAHEQLGNRVAFQCPLDQIVDEHGFHYSSAEWHPFRATLQEYGEGLSDSYDNSVLKEYYTKHRPKNAADVFSGMDIRPSFLVDCPPHLYRLRPWRTKSKREMDVWIRKLLQEDNKEHGMPEFKIETHGELSYGPVSREKGKLEFRRLVNVYESINNKGYERGKGHVTVYILKRKKEYAFLRRDGGHRIPAMSSLGRETIPAVFKKPCIVDIDMVEHWPQVKRGHWTKEEAKAYFNHLFDFDSRNWAKEHDLL